MRKTREEILGAAAFYVGREGVRVPSMKELADELAISRSTLYYHFPDKSDLLYAILLRTTDLFLEKADEVVSYPLPARDRLRLLIRAVMVLMVQVPASSLPTIVSSEGNILSKAQMQTFVARRDEYDGRFRGLIRDGINQGEFRPVNVKLTTFAILGMVDAFGGWYHPEDEYSVEQVADAYADLLIQSLSPEAEPGPLTDKAEGRTRHREGRAARNSGRPRHDGSAARHAVSD